MDSNVLIIAGMHRSGTSLVGQWISHMGINLGDKLLKPDFSNEKGHYEDLDFLSFHKEILIYNNYNETGLNLKPDNSILRLSNYHFEKGISIIDFKKRLHMQWGWKEPRTCLFLDYYNRFLPNAKYLFIFRDCNYVIDSLIRRDKKRLWLWYSKQGLLGLLKKIALYKYKCKNIETAFKEYEHQWLIYNKKLLNHIEKIPSKNYKTIDLSRLSENENQIIEQLQNWNFNIIPKKINSVFEKSLFTKKTKKTYPLGEDTKLLQKEIEEVLKRNLDRHNEKIC